MTLSELRYKEVVNLSNGSKLGYIGDCEIDLDSGTVRALIVPGRYKFFGILGREDDYVIPWDKINVIGDDLVLIEQEDLAKNRRKREKRK